MTLLETFLITTGRTLSQMALYPPEHPSVKGSVIESHRLLTDLLQQEEEVVISLNEGRLIVNGQTPDEAPEAALRPFIQLLDTFNLHSLSFLKGLALEEMVSFFHLAVTNELKKSNLEPAIYLSKFQFEHIKFNQAKYAKIGEDELIAAQEPTPADIFQGEAFNRAHFEDLDLNGLLRKLIERSVSDPADREFVFKHALNLVKKQLDDAVEKATAEIRREKTKILNERERTEEVVGTMAEGVVVVDETGRVLMMNPAAESIYGVKLGESLGKPLWEGVREEQMMALAKDLTVPTDRPITKEVMLKGSADVQRTLRASSATIQDPNGRIVGMVSVLSDVTKQKNLTRMQNEFMANVTHDLRAPIHTLKLAVNTILGGDAGPMTTDQQKMLSMASRNVDRLARLIDDLLDFSKIESGAMEIHPQIIEISPLLKEAAQSMESWARTRGIKIKSEELKDLPFVFADADRILQVVNNLISNAIKFTPAGGAIILRAKKMTENGKSMVQVDVQDTGTGISPADQARIFQRFVQLQQTEKTDVRGTGLGLSICKALVELHKGQLTLQSPPPGSSQGSLFSFTLQAVQRSEAVAIQHAAKKSTPPPPLAPKKGLIRRLLSRFKLALLLPFIFAVSLQARPHQGEVRRVRGPLMIQLQDGSLVRYLGVAAPEKGTGAYNEAVSANQRLVENKEVSLRYGLQERDAEGHWQAYVYADGIFVNEELVREGLLVVSPLPNEETILRELNVAEKDARRRKRGLWRNTTVDIDQLRAKEKFKMPSPSPALPSPTAP